MRPTIVCLCGSTRFGAAFDAANLAETLAGRVVLSVGCHKKSDAEHGFSAEVKARLDQLHLDKIDMADEVLFLNVGGYIGESTRRELAYAIYCRHVPHVPRFLEHNAGVAYLREHQDSFAAYDKEFKRRREPR